MALPAVTRPPGNDRSPSALAEDGGRGRLDSTNCARPRAARVRQQGGSWVYTRNHPRRDPGGAEPAARCLWVIRGQIRVRQRVTGFRRERDEKGRAYCLIEVEPVLLPTVWRPWQPFQGWRYLTPADAPPDAPHGYAPADLARGADAGTDAGGTALARPLVALAREGYIRPAVRAPVPQPRSAEFLAGEILFISL